MSYRNQHEHLNHLIELCRDEALTLRDAASRVKDASAKTLLEELAEARMRFAADLLPHAQRLGGDSPGTGTTRGALHRQWLAFKARLAGTNDAAMIAEAEQAEDHALAEYSRALDDLIQPAARDLLEQQQAELRSAYARVRDLMLH